MYEYESTSINVLNILFSLKDVNDADDVFASLKDQEQTGDEPKH